jgi:hypothetical protein
MKKYLPHLSFFGVILAIIIIGMATNSREVAKLAGALVGLSIDPIVIVGGLLIGFFLKGQLKIIGAAIIFGVIASIVITNINSSSFSPIILVVRCVAVIAWSYVANIIVLARTKP